VFFFVKFWSTMSRRNATSTLYVSGFGPAMRAKDLAYEFERFGRLVRCDIPAPRNINARPYADGGVNSTRRFAFVEYEDARDADDAFHDMHNRRIGRDVFTVEWAKNTPSSSWRFEGGRDRPNREGERAYDRERGGDRDFSRRDPPRRRSPIGDRAPRGEPSPARRDDRNGRRGRSYSRSPARSPPRRVVDRSRSPRGGDRRDRDDRDDRDDKDDLRDVRTNGDDLDKYDDKELVED